MMGAVTRLITRFPAFTPGFCGVQVHERFPLRAFSSFLQDGPRRLRPPRTPARTILCASLTTLFPPPPPAAAPRCHRVRAYVPMAMWVGCRERCEVLCAQESERGGMGGGGGEREREREGERERERTSERGNARVPASAPVPACVCARAGGNIHVHACVSMSMCERESAHVRRACVHVSTRV